jgi:predicted patatin/cPLA2 family phospholipase
VVSLVVEGRGMRGAVPAGMCLTLEAAGRMSSMDRVYGCSSGALKACSAAAGQTSPWAAGFDDCACRTFVDPSRALRGRRASCAIPVLTGTPPLYRGGPTVDGGLLEPIPDRTAMREGATHVLVLRSRDATYRAPRHGKLAERTLARAHPELVPLLRMSSARDNLDAVGLERRAWRSSGVPHVRQIAVPTGSRLVSRFRIDHPRIADSVRQRALTTEAATTPRPAA